jgi:putative hydrolase of the HAD superfamily
MSRWRAVVFDLDDTLYPERDYVRGGFEAVARWASATTGEPYQAAFDELWAMFEAGVRHDTFDRWLQRRGRGPEPDRGTMIEVYRRQRPRLAPYADVLPALTGLRHQMRLGLITEGPSAVQQAKLDALGLRPWFDKIVVLGEDERADWKPSRRPFDRWLEGGVIRPEAAVYVGDNPAKDFLAARRAGWSSVRVRRSDGLHRGEEPLMDEARPDREIPDLRSLETILETFEADSR